MKKRLSGNVWALLLSVFLVSTLVSCGSAKHSVESATPNHETQFSDTNASAANSDKLKENKSGSTPGSTDKQTMTMKITVGSTTFTAKLYDNKTTQALISQLPMTVDMTELNGREKYYRFSKDLPVESTEQPKTIHAGEIMCWSSDSLVLFYNTFSNSYGGYVRLGYIEDVSGLASAIGRGNVQVTFAISN
jgi:hypothetical protein